MTLWAEKTSSSSIPNETTEGRTNLTKGRTFNTKTKTKPNTDKGKNPWYQTDMDNLLGLLSTFHMAREDNNTKGNAKTHLKKLTPFHGDRKLIRKLLQECNLYIIGNSKDFPDDASKIIFILSYMDDGEAEKWKQYYINNEVITARNYVWPKASDFYTKVKEAFAFKDEKEDSVRKLETLKQGNRNAEEMTNEFQLLVTKAGLNEDNQMLICTPWTHNLLTRSCIPQTSLPCWKIWELVLPSRKDGTLLWHSMTRFIMKHKKLSKNDNQLGAYDMLRRTPTTMIQLCTMTTMQSKCYGCQHNHDGSQCHVLWRMRQMSTWWTLLLLQATQTYLLQMPKEVTHECRELWCRTPMQQPRSICLIQQCFQQEAWCTQEIGTSRTQQVYSSTHQWRMWTHVWYGWSWW